MSFRPRRLLVPLLASGAVLATAPFLGRLRDALLAAFPGTALTILAVAVGAALALALALALARIRERRALRYGGLALCAAAVAAQVVGFTTGQPQVDAVQRIHIVEYGLLAVLYFRALLPLGGTAVPVLATLAGALVGILDEWLQWLVPTRVGEVMDVALNLAATATGVLFALCLFPPLRRRSGHWAGLHRWAAGLGAVVVLAFGGFYHSAHLGYLVEDAEERVVFRSWYPPHELPRVAAERGERWQAGRPPALDPLSREDRLFTEGTWRVSHRNASLERGDVLSAWREQRILERYYAPVLAERGLRSGEPLALGEEAREALRAAAAPLEHHPYESPVLVERIALSPSKGAWWLGVGTLAAALAALAAWRSPPSRSSSPKSKLPARGLQHGAIPPGREMRCLRPASGRL